MSAPAVLAISLMYTSMSRGDGPVQYPYRRRPILNWYSSGHNVAAQRAPSGRTPNAWTHRPRGHADRRDHRSPRGSQDRSATPQRAALGIGITIYAVPLMRFPTKPCCLVRNRSDAPTPIFSDNCASLRVFIGAATPTRRGRVMPTSRTSRSHCSNAAGSKHSLADHVVGVALLAQQTFQQRLVVDVRVSFGIRGVG